MQAVVQRTGWLVPVILVLGALGLSASYGVAVRSNPRIVTTPASFAPVSSAIAPMSIAVFPPEIDLAKVQGADACGECHIPDMDAWKQSTHQANWRMIHRGDRAQDILKALEIKGGMRRNDLCFNCHYTARVVVVDEKPKMEIVSGVSCESCHGAAADWINVHDDYGADKTKETETPEHRAMRLKACDASGMLRPANVYLIARNCYSCHSVPNEKLVNVGGHPAGSDFELVSWSQGEVRHNYQFAPDKKNREASPQRKRVLFIVGALTDLEYSLRGLAKATEKGTYRTAMYRRVNRALRRLDLMLARNCSTEVADALNAVPRMDPYENPDRIGKLTTDIAIFPKLGEVADKVAEAVQRFVANHDGSGLTALDILIPGPDKYKGEAQP